jgi:hypothetical protein
MELLDHDGPGFWETRGYYNYGDPWKEQRYEGDRKRGSTESVLMSALARRGPKEGGDLGQLGTWRIRQPNLDLPVAHPGR